MNIVYKSINAEYLVKIINIYQVEGDASDTSLIRTRIKNQKSKAYVHLRKTGKGTYLRNDVLCTLNTYNIYKK